MELGAVTDAAVGGIADGGGGRGSYRVIDFKPAKFCSGPIVRLAARTIADENAAARPLDFRPASAN
jgi:hypothetical protein